jgi:hypothetical protein
MAAITWTDVTNHDSSLSSVDANAQTDILAFVNAALDVACFDGEGGPKTKLTRIYLAAHFATLANVSSGGSGGPVTAESLGDESRSYGSFFAMSSSALAATGYGIAYLSMVNTSAAKAPMLL